MSTLPSPRRSMPHSHRTSICRCARILDGGCRGRGHAARVCIKCAYVPVPRDRLVGGSRRARSPAKPLASATGSASSQNSRAGSRNTQRATHSLVRGRSAPKRRGCENCGTTSETARDFWEFGNISEPKRIFGRSSKEAPEFTGGRSVRSQATTGYAPHRPLPRTGWGDFGRKRAAIHSEGGCYSITSSARSSIPGGTVRPSALAVLRLMISEYLVGY